MINQVIVEQKEREEPASLKEGLTRMESARAALFTFMNQKYVDPLETEYEPLATKEEAGATHFFKGNKQLFSIESNTYVTKKSDPETTFQMISLIADQGSESIRVIGKREFRKQAWLFATLRGLDVEGYNPTQADELLLEYARSRQNAITPDSDLEKSKTTQETRPKEGLDSSSNDVARTRQAQEIDKSVKSETPSEAGSKLERQNQETLKTESPTPIQVAQTSPTPREQTDELWDLVAQLRYADSGEFYQALYDNAAELPSEVALKTLYDRLPEGQDRPMAETLLAGLVTSSRAPYVKSVLEHLPSPVEKPDSFANLYRDYREASDKRDKAHASGAFKDAQQAQIALNRIESKVYALVVKQVSPILETRMSEPTPLPFSSKDRHIVDEYLNPQRWAAVNKERALREMEFGHHADILHVENSIPSQSEKDLNPLVKQRDELKEKINQCIVEGHDDPARWYRHEKNLVELEILWLSTRQPIDLKQTYPVAGEPLALNPSQAAIVKKTPDVEATVIKTDWPKSPTVPSSDDDALLAPVVLPPCLAQLKDQANEALAEIQDAAILYGDQFCAYRSLVEASVQSKLGTDPSNHENASLIIDSLSNSYEIAAPILLEGLDISAAKNAMVQRFEDRKQEIEKTISKFTPLEASVAVEHETLLEHLARLKNPSKAQRNHQVSFH